MQTFVNPEEILDELELKPDMAVAEFGCGSGGFSIPLSKLLDEGIVYALDIQKAPLSALKSRALLENITNIKIINCDLEEPRGSTLSDSSVDAVLIPNVLFQIKDKSAIITEAKRVLKNHGKLVIIDWLPKATQGPEQGKVSPDEIKKLSKELGFKLQKDSSAGKYHFVLVLEKK